ncbi:uncharacterized protein B0H18DRAFT_960041 [Fomitopsis serialis]|uniref:uncharacterized protein n=1 Tax=Fomitopsis serialis TaxID=139415 RepID=UPI0020072086|nr:uncharacterized protein B0H18DRAFT_960041 [Neoantrodia serialis]KAH9914036.1 hypothetical protein B0H18DRAFT_960041 [Neoantrodia serialis]
MLPQSMFHKDFQSLDSARTQEDVGILSREAFCMSTTNTFAYLLRYWTSLTPARMPQVIVSITLVGTQAMVTVATNAVPGVAVSRTATVAIPPPAPLPAPLNLLGPVNTLLPAHSGAQLNAVINLMLSGNTLAEDKLLAINSVLLDEVGSVGHSMLESRHYIKTLLAWWFAHCRPAIDKELTGFSILEVQALIGQYIMIY